MVFQVASEVFEHIPSPVERAFSEAYKLLKPDGVLCLSVPFSLLESNIERFSGLSEFTVATLSGSPVLIHRTREGAIEVREDLIFHGGEGATLEMRIFSREELEKALYAAGFRGLSFQAVAEPRFGIEFDSACSLPLVARKQEFPSDRRTVSVLLRELIEVQARHKEAVATKQG